MNRLMVLVIVVLLFTSGWEAPSAGFVQLQNEPIYVFPRPEAELIPVGTTLAVRYRQFVDEKSLSAELFQAVGSKSGVHSGQTLLADDQKTVIFKPESAFMNGEIVTVTLRAGLRAADGGELKGTSYRFTTSTALAPADLSINSLLKDENIYNKLPLPAYEVDAFLQDAPVFRTAPADLPRTAVMVPADGVDEGNIFLSNWRWGEQTMEGSYLLIVDNTGQPVYYQPMAPGTRAFDFKKQPGGLLTYFDSGTGCFQAMNETYQPVDSYCAGNGYPSADLHDLQVLSDGHALFMIYDYQLMDMSKVVVGGVPEATVIGLVIQELDPSKNVVFEWRSWDHIELTDSTEDLTRPLIDYVHGNAVELDSDGNIMVSSRHLDEVTKIDRQTGEVLWRLGGKKNQFTFLHDDLQFSHQHDIRRLPNGNISLFDNRTGRLPIFSRAVEYQLDENQKSASLVWQYRNAPDTYSLAMGNAQRLPNGNTLIGWGTGFPSITEVKPDKKKAFELTLASPTVTYRAFRFPWQGKPAWEPALVVETQGSTTSLYYSWNGATDVASYRIYAGNDPDPKILIATQNKTGFENSTILHNVQEQYCSYKILPVDSQGLETRFSNVAFTGPPCQLKTQYFPYVSGR